MRQLGTKELQNHILSMMKEVHTFCVKNDIQYSLEGGSLIGAIRHKGFIPWDDDIDIMLTRPNFEKLCRCFKHDNLKIMVPGQKGYYLRFARIIDTKHTIVKEHKIPFADQETGIWIDVFPIDSEPEHENDCHDLIKRCENLKYYALQYRYSLMNRAMICKSESLQLKFNNLITFLRRRVRLFKRHPSLPSVEKLIAQEKISLIKNWDNNSNNYIGVCFAHNKYTNLYRKDWFDDYISVPFEDTELRILKCYDDYLKMVFGNYMIVPPKEKQVVHNFYKVYWFKE